MIIIPDLFSPWIQGREAAIKANWNDIEQFNAANKNMISNYEDYATLGPTIQNRYNQTALSGEQAYASWMNNQVARANLPTETMGARQRFEAQRQLGAEAALNSIGARNAQDRYRWDVANNAPRTNPQTLPQTSSTTTATTTLPTAQSVQLPGQVPVERRYVNPNAPAITGSALESASTLSDLANTVPQAVTPDLFPANKSSTTTNTLVDLEALASGANTLGRSTDTVDASTIDVDYSLLTPGAIIQTPSGAVFMDGQGQYWLQRGNGSNAMTYRINFPNAFPGLTENEFIGDPLAGM